MTEILIKKGRLVDPVSGLDGVRDVLIEEGKIKRIAPKIITIPPNTEIIDAAGKIVLPGLIDMHTHLRDPGRPDKETIASGSKAAALGGFTTICCMANTDPPIDNPAVVEYILAKAKAEAAVNVLPVAAITKGLAGEALSEMGRCYAEGAVAFSDDGRPVMRADVMRRALEYAKQYGATIVSHCEDANLSTGGVINESLLSTEIGLPAVPAIAEEIMVARDIMLAREYGRVHLAHVSSAGSVRLIRQAKKEKINVSAETCPHYFCLTEEAARNYDTNAKVNPPLRSPADVKEIKLGLKDGTIDVIASDHAPHNIEEKNIEFNQAASGIIGLETTLGLALTHLVETKVLTLKKLIEKLSAGPAKILKLSQKGALKVGFDADIIVLDRRITWKVNPATFASRSRNTPFAGWQLKGKVTHTIVGGRLVVKDSQLIY